MKTLAVCAPAKINLDLRILGRRSDGYHEVRTLLQTINLVDEIHATAAPPDILDLQVDPVNSAPPGSDNLVMRAAEALRRHTGVDAGARLKLVKRIPIAAGLGGGSSDAAATLVVLDALWDLRLEPGVLEELAAGLGSDVPFFLAGGLALATGRGEIVRSLPDLLEYGVVVCAPAIEVSTADVYDRLATTSRLTSGRPEDTVDAFAAGIEQRLRVEPPWHDLRNDLEPVVIEEWPEVGRAVTALKAVGPLHVAVTGSGAAAFAVFSDLEAAREGVARLEKGWDLFVASTLGRSIGRPVVK
jgi:4-diphosphocytidyl-2-C-methyl-D-erythritol kinase